MRNVLMSLLVAAFFALPGASLAQGGHTLTHPTDCTTYECNRRRDGYVCVDQDDGAFYVCNETAGTWGTITPGANRYVAITGDDAPATAVGQNSFTLIDLSLTELVDELDSFDTNGGEICYVGVPSINVEIFVTFSFERTAGTGANTASVALGKGVGFAPVDGDEANVSSDTYERTMSTNSNTIGMGAVSGTATVNNDDCLGLMATSTGGSISFRFTAAAVHIKQF
jgi:hypothetical protein